MENQIIIQQPTSVFGVLDLFNTSEEGIARFSQLVINEVENGNVDPLRVAVFMKTLEKISERVNKVCTPYYVNEAEKYNQRVVTHLGSEISVVPVGVKIDYSVCNHPGWNDLTKIINEATEQRKVIEEFLKALKSPMPIVIEGEAVVINPPVRSGSDGIKISIK